MGSVILEFHTWTNAALKALGGWFHFVSTEPAKTTYFGFPQFLSTFSMFVVLYNTTDTRFRFRTAVAPINLRKWTFAAFCILGGGTLLSDFWFSNNWKLPFCLSNPILWQMFFGAFYFALIFAWVFFAFIKPPVFGRSNAKLYYEEVFRMIARGTNDELRAVVQEVGNSMAAIVKLAASPPIAPRQRNRFEDQRTPQEQEPSPQQFAWAFFLLIGTRKFCRCVAQNVPGTAIELFTTVTNTRSYGLPISQFAANVFTEALSDSDSILYHEDSAYESGIIGHLKVFKNALFSDSSLIETLAAHSKSPLDLSYSFGDEWTEKSLTVYGECFLIFFKSYFEKSLLRANFSHSFAFARALDTVKSACNETYKLQNIENYYEAKPFKLLSRATRILSQIMSYLGNRRETPNVRIKTTKDMRHSDPFSMIAECMLDIIFQASSITSDHSKCWAVHYISVWNHFFGSYSWKDSQFVRLVLSRLRRRLYEEITKDMFTFQSARYLGFCLNVMGLKLASGRSGRIDLSHYALHKTLLKWTKANFLKLHQDNPKVAEAALIGDITFDAANKRLVQTGDSFFGKPPHIEYLNLEEPPANVPPKPDGGIPLPIAASNVSPILALAPVVVSASTKSRNGKRNRV